MRFLVRRVIFYLVTAWAAVTINFFVPRLIPGDPVQSLINKYQGQLSTDAIHSLYVLFGLDKKVSLWDQYWHEWGKLGDLLGAEYDAEKARVEPILEPLFDEYKMIRDGLIAQSNVSFTRLYDLAAMQRWEFWDEDGKHSEDFDADIENAMLTLVEALARGGADA